MRLRIVKVYDLGNKKWVYNIQRKFWIGWVLVSLGDKEVFDSQEEAERICILAKENYSIVKEL